MANGRTRAAPRGTRGCWRRAVTRPRFVPYRPLWSVLLLGWVVSYADRTRTGP
jgi:hypothetical protein